VKRLDDRRPQSGARWRRAKISVRAFSAPARRFTSGYLLFAAAAANKVQIRLTRYL
jgi:hypothetical protein